MLSGGANEVGGHWKRFRHEGRGVEARPIWMDLISVQDAVVRQCSKLITRQALPRSTCWRTPRRHLGQRPALSNNLQRVHGHQVRSSRQEQLAEFQSALRWTLASASRLRMFDSIRENLK